jgi:hypothetical protein
VQLLYGTKKFSTPPRRDETKLKGGVLNGKKESKKGGAQGKEGSEAQGSKGGKASPINISPAPILLTSF